MRLINNDGVLPGNSGRVVSGGVAMPGMMTSGCGPMMTSGFVRSPSASFIGGGRRMSGVLTDGCMPGWGGATMLSGSRTMLGGGVPVLSGSRTMLGGSRTMLGGGVPVLSGSRTMLGGVGCGPMMTTTNGLVSNVNLARSGLLPYNNNMIGWPGLRGSRTLLTDGCGPNWINGRRSFVNNFGPMVINGGYNGRFINRGFVDPCLPRRGGVRFVDPWYGRGGIPTPGVTNVTVPTETIVGPNSLPPVNVIPGPGSETPFNVNPVIGPGGMAPENYRPLLTGGTINRL